MALSATGPEAGPGEPSIEDGMPWVVALRCRLTVKDPEPGPEPGARLFLRESGAEPGLEPIVTTPESEDVEALRASASGIP